jgi:hypothetical protein
MSGLALMRINERLLERRSELGPDVADITFSEVDDTSSSVGEIRIAFSSALDEDGWCSGLG